MMRKGLQMKRILSALVISLFLFTLSSSCVCAVAQDEFINYDSVMQYLSGDEIYDLGLWDNHELAVAVLRRDSHTFDSLCSLPNIVPTLESIQSRLSTDDIRFLWVWIWLEGLGVNTRATLESEADIHTPSGKVIPAYRFTGTDAITYPSNISQYTSAQYLYAATYKYNCHTFSWYFHGSLSGITDDDKVKIYNPSAFYSTLGYGRCYNKITTTPQVGDIALYVYDVNPTTKEYVHSATITSVSNGTGHSQIVVKSKWGQYPVYSNILSDCTYYSETMGHTGGRIEYYRPNHSYGYYAIDATKHKRACAYCGHRSSIANHTFVTVGNHSECSKCGYYVGLPINELPFEFE